MKAAPEAQRRLLDLQAIDTSLAQLAHRRKSLPELAEIDKISRELSAMEDERVRAQVAVDDLDRDIARFEKDIEQVRTRKDRDKAGSRPAAPCARSRASSTSWPPSTGASRSWRTPSSSSWSSGRAPSRPSTR